MSEEISYSPSYESYTPLVPQTPTLWQRAFARAQDEIAAAGGLGATRDLFADIPNGASWLSTAQREDALQAAMQTALADLTSQSASWSNFEDASSIVRLSSMVAALAQVPQLAALASLAPESEHIQQEAGELLRMAQANSGHDLAARAVSAEQQLRGLAARAHQHLADAERELVQELVGNSLKDLGYQLHTKGTSIRATRGTTCIWASVNERGGLDLDVSGFSGRTCQTETKALENIMQQHGLVLKRSATVTHQQRTGGDLARRLASAFAPCAASSMPQAWGKPVEKSQRQMPTPPVKSVLKSR